MLISVLIFGEGAVLVELFGLIFIVSYFTGFVFQIK